ncbi:NifB/MoaA-like Fe-S oxidoreductase [Bacillus tianshenii]|uniref:NifB/MoaA-like Fe-S oxidoreductase n=1 Tax=Sutcliffiella tianshenii TaxID=1463404 RepID=A0ABS2NZF8_9BACI|nr:hypothetical protein [Bacillus tianshenii]MBM7619595.1 NifB/MoaA-like Fe-S oxidoreductase [Bacillus tianshenii]MCA1321043.1 hypothetical protein [Bacillus tianshenii]
MVTKPLQIFIEYPIKDTVIQKYEDTMKNVIGIMKDLGAEEIRWTKISQQDRGHTYYTETFLLPTESHYFAMKELRAKARDGVFHDLSQCMDPGSGAIHYIGLKIIS